MNDVIIVQCDEYSSHLLRQRIDEMLLQTGMNARIIVLENDDTADKVDERRSPLLNDSALMEDIKAAVEAYNLRCLDAPVPMDCGLELRRNRFEPFSKQDINKYSHKPPRTIGRKK